MDRATFPRDGVPGPVAGIRGRTADGAAVPDQDRTAVAVGGSHAIIARTVRAPVYHARPTPGVGHCSYWTGVPITGGEAYQRDGGAVLALPTDGGATVIRQRWRWARGAGTSIEPSHTFAQFRG